MFRLVTSWNYPLKGTTSRICRLLFVNTSDNQEGFILCQSILFYRKILLILPLRFTWKTCERIRQILANNAVQRENKPHESSQGGNVKSGLCVRVHFTFQPSVSRVSDLWKGPTRHITPHIAVKAAITICIVMDNRSHRNVRKVKNVPARTSKIEWVKMVSQ